MLVTIAASLGASLEEVAWAASLYYLLYGAMQPVWGTLSDKLGRVRVIRLSLVAVLVPGLVSAFAPNLTALVVGRALSGGLFAAIIPASLVYIGDTVPINARQRALADQLATSAVATALATAAAGLAAYLGYWRVAFAAPVLVSAALGLFLLSRLPEPEREVGAGPLARLGLAVRKPWAGLVVGLALVEGGVILGFLTYLAPALEYAGYSAAVSGLVVGLFGVATLGWTRLVRGVSERFGKHILLLAGGGLLALGYAAGAAGQNLVGISLAACLVGGGFAFMHSTLQTWATEVVPEARATVISFFAAALFVGSAIATFAAAPLAEAGSFGTLFALAALVAVPLTLSAGFARLRYDAREKS
ncbi:MFS transporter [Rubrobacter marinus]|uniref:MFS transporter n=2 Tax=Rubrobacter marinus TaxID=2653852 RepID=A0A6G8Q310_9ACTN|nr:MFS transporter [Rubrobacter marinus]